MDGRADGQCEWTGWETLAPVLRHANFYDAQPGGGFGPRYITDFQLLFVQSGVGSAQVGDERYSIGAGDIVFYGPNERHEVVSTVNAPLRLLGLHFVFRIEDAVGVNADLCAHGNSSPIRFETPAPICLLSPPPPPWLRPRNPAPMRSRVEALVLSHIAAPATRLIEKRGLMLQMLQAWHDALRASPSVDTPRHPAVDAACAAIARDLGASHTVSTLSSRAGVSADHLGRLFKRHTGLSVRQYVREQRLIEARRLLVEGRSNVAEVAWALGYDDPFYFSRIFHEAFGVPPSRFRNQFPFT